MREYAIGLGALLLGLAVGALLAVALTSCSAEQGYLPSRPRSQSWDQEALKAHDHGCPEAIYIAPNGVLVQCPPY